MLPLVPLLGLGWKNEWDLLTVGCLFFNCFFNEFYVLVYKFIDLLYKIIINGFVSLQYIVLNIVI
jgi:hypothetical protein